MFSVPFDYKFYKNWMAVGIFATEKVAIMFSVPYDYNTYKNWMAMGIYKKEITTGESLFKEM